MEALSVEWELAAATWSGMAYHGGGCSVSAARKRIYLLFLERPRTSSRLSRFFLFSFVWLLRPC